MLTLTVRNPWAHLIAHGLKKIENRSWFTAHRGPLAIHAAKSPSPADLMEELERDGIIAPGAELSYGAIIAVVNVIDCIALDNLAPELAADPFAVGPWCWILADARLVTPIPCKGKLKLWTGPTINDRLEPLREGKPTHEPPAPGSAPPPALPPARKLGSTSSTGRQSWDPRTRQWRPA